ncbi:ISAs1 family transposase [Streptomyces mirabilis]|uniref:ISAs1 family transposase n=1 Tax=Streptomyces mirabilis TaxID=68239 RepID=UPI00365AB592
MTPWTGPWAPTWPTGTAPPTSQPRRRRRPRPGGRAWSLSTAKHTGDQPASPCRAGICSLRSPTTPSCLAQVGVGAKTSETTHFQPLLAPLDLTGAVVTFDALCSVKANISWLVETKKAHCISVIKTNQPTAHSQLAALPWRDITVQHTAAASGHGRHESRSIKTCAVADELGGIAFPHARLAIRVHRRRKQTGKRETRESVYAVASLDAHQTGPAGLAAAICGHWGVENSSHHIRDATFAGDASTVHAGTAPRAMATLRNLAIGVLTTLGADNIAKTTRAIRDEPQRAFPILGITTIRTPTELDKALHPQPHVRAADSGSAPLSRDTDASGALHNTTGTSQFGLRPGIARLEASLSSRSEILRDRGVSSTAYARER